MRQLKRNRRSFLLCLFFLILSAGFALTVHASGVKKILILPFAFNSGENQDLRFLEKGINRMLHTRLHHANQTVTLFPEKGSAIPGDPIEAGIQYNADYVLTGSITMFGEKISTDALFYSVADKKEILAFGDFGQTKGDAIAHVNDLAVKINFDVFGIETLPSMAQQQRMMADSRYGYKKIPKFGLPNAFQFRSPTIDGGIISVAAGDINGDNLTDIVYALPSRIVVMSGAGGKTAVMAEHKTSGFSRILRIETADFNRNGKDEIIITAGSNRDLKNDSLAIEMDAGNVFRQIPLKENFFYALQHTAAGQPVLVAQAREKQETFKNAVFAMAFMNTGFDISDTAVPRPSDSDIYAYTTGNILNDGAVSFARYSEDESIQVLNSEMIEQWRIEGEYGKSTAFFNTRPGMAAKDDPFDPYFIDQRLLVADLNGDKKNELIVVRNVEGLTDLLARVRIIQRGQIEVYSWEKDQGMVKVWETRSISGGIADVNVGDVNNDGKTDIVYAVVPSSKGLLDMVSSQKSYIAVQGF